jgi:transposase
MAIFEAIATLRGVELLAWLTDVLERMVSDRTKAHELARLLPWNWKPSASQPSSMPECCDGQATLAAQ